MQARYQYGNLTLRERKKGPDVWQFRWMENGRLRSVLIGTIKKHPTRSDAERAVEHLRIKINSHNFQSQFHAVTVGGLIDRFVQHELPNGRRFQTQSGYCSYFNHHIRPRWETCSWSKLNRCRSRTGSRLCPLHQRLRVIFEMRCICFFNGHDGGE